MPISSAARRASSTSDDAAAPGVALAAPQPHRHADDVVAVAREQRGRDRRVDPAAHRHHDLHRRSPAIAGRSTGVATRRTSRPRPSDRSTSARRRARRRPRSWCARASAAAPRRVSAGSTPIAASTCECSIAPLAQADAAEAQTPGLVEQEQQRLALDAFDQHVGRTGHLRLARHRLVDAVEPSGDAGDEPVTEAAIRAVSTRRSASVAASAAAVAMMPGTLCVPLRRSRSWPPPTMSGSIAEPCRDRRARRRPSARRTCGR